VTTEYRLCSDSVRFVLLLGNGFTQHAEGLFHAEGLSTGGYRISKVP